MPSRVPKSCKKPGCPNITTAKHGYCKEHTSLHWGKRSKTTTERGYGTKWQKTRLIVLKHDPFCTFPGCKKFANEVDHIDGDKDNTQLSNLRSYCRQHHALKTKLVDNPATKVMTFQRWEEKFKKESKT